MCQIDSFSDDIRNHSRKLFVSHVNLNVVLDVAGVPVLMGVHMKHSLNHHLEFILALFDKRKFDFYTRFNINYLFLRQSFWRGHLSLKDAAGNEHLRVVGPCCICQGVCCCCCENKFTVNLKKTREIHLLT
jgi:hypothetical protein